MKCREMSGIDFLKQLLPVHPIPVDSGIFPEPEGFDALEAGAVDFVRKPDEANGLSKEIFLSTLRSKLMVAAASHVHLPLPRRPLRQVVSARFLLYLLPEILSCRNQKIPLGSSPETVIAIRGIYRRYRSHSRGSKEFSLQILPELLSPSTCLPVLQPCMQTV